MKRVFIFFIIIGTKDIINKN